MKALVHTQPLTLEFQDVPDPVPEPDELVVRVRACGICGSDVQGYTGTTGRRIPPIIMGHEAAGVVERVGTNVTRFQGGERICFDSTIYCNTCAACAAGLYNRCESRQVLGVSTPDSRRDGAFAEFVRIPWWSAVVLDDSVSFEEATLFEPLAIALHAVNRGAVGREDAVLVVGCGTIGLLTIAAARHRGALTIVASDVRPERRERARQMGASLVVDASRQSAREALEEAGVEIDVAVEAVGVGATIRDACASVRSGGRVVLLGNLERRVELDVPDLIAREITLVGSYANAGEFRDAVRLVSEKKIDVRPLLSESHPLSAGQQAFDRLREGREDLTKIVLTP